MKYITIEGIDTSGKSTQISKLKTIYSNALFTKEPGGTIFGSALRQILLEKTINSKYAEFFLFLSDRAEHIHKLKQLNPDMIITDRSLISGIAYAKDIDIDTATKLNIISCDGLLPTQVVFLKISRKELTNRLNKKTNDKIEQRGVEYLLDIQNNISKVINKLQIDNIVLDASSHPDILTSKIQKFIK
ncbi:MAG: dTMP kinase [Epsilonproteobacteria bacterium]|nr:MAG: dTMP kinase [Campylobacterota bacterium]